MPSVASGSTLCLLHRKKNPQRKTTSRHSVRGLPGFPALWLHTSALTARLRVLLGFFCFFVTCVRLFRSFLLNAGKPPTSFFSESPVARRRCARAFCRRRKQVAPRICLLSVPLRVEWTDRRCLARSSLLLLLPSLLRLFTLLPRARTSLHFLELAAFSLLPPRRMPLVSSRACGGRVLTNQAQRLTDSLPQAGVRNTTRSQLLSVPPPQFVRVDSLVFISPRPTPPSSPPSQECAGAGSRYSGSPLSAEPRL